MLRLCVTAGPSAAALRGTTKVTASGRADGCSGALFSATPPQKAYLARDNQLGAHCMRVSSAGASGMGTLGLARIQR